MERRKFVDANDTIDELTKEERHMPIKLFMKKGFPLTCMEQKGGTWICQVDVQVIQRDGIPVWARFPQLH